MMVIKYSGPHAHFLVDKKAFENLDAESKAKLTQHGKFYCKLKMPCGCPFNIQFKAVQKGSTSRSLVIKSGKHNGPHNHGKYFTTMVN
jgi:hypothetical protein